MLASLNGGATGAFVSLSPSPLFRTVLLGGVATVVIPIFLKGFFLKFIVYGIFSVHTRTSNEESKTISGQLRQSFYPLELWHFIFHYTFFNMPCYVNPADSETWSYATQRQACWTPSVFRPSHVTRGSETEEAEDLKLLPKTWSPRPPSSSSDITVGDTETAPGNEDEFWRASTVEHVIHVSRPLRARLSETTHNWLPPRRP